MLCASLSLAGPEMGLHNRPAGHVSPAWALFWEFARLTWLHRFHQGAVAPSPNPSPANASKRGESEREELQALWENPPGPPAAKPRASPPAGQQQQQQWRTGLVSKFQLPTSRSVAVTMHRFHRQAACATCSHTGARGLRSAG